MNRLCCFCCILVLLLTQSCASNKESEKDSDKEFEAFYKDKERKFLDCLDFQLNKYAQDIACETLKTSLDKRFDLNGINADKSIVGLELETATWDSNPFCPFSTKYEDNTDKAIFDETLNNSISKIDTIIALNQDTLSYSVDISKTNIAFNCENKRFKVKMITKIVESIDLLSVKNLDAFHRTKIETCINNVKKRYL